MQQSLISDQLKDRTLANHQKLEKNLIGWMKNIQNKQEYTRLLQLFYGYFGALEDHIGQYIDTGTLPDQHHRRKAQSISDDIITLGGTVPPKATGNDLPHITTPLQAFGALYVIEGSTLGGKIIAKMMSRQLNLPDGNGLSFFSGYGEQTDEMWASFKNVLNRQAQTGHDAEEIISAADETFVKFNSWFEKNG